MTVSPFESRIAPCLVGRWLLLGLVDATLRPITFFTSLVLCMHSLTVFYSAHFIYLLHRVRQWQILQ